MNTNVNLMVEDAKRLYRQVFRAAVALDSLEYHLAARDTTRSRELRKYHDQQLTIAIQNLRCALGSDELSQRRQICDNTDPARGAALNPED